MMHVDDNDQVTRQCPPDDFIYAGKEDRVNGIRRGFSGMTVPANGNSNGFKTRLFDNIEIFLLNNYAFVAFVGRFEALLMFTPRCIAATVSNAVGVSGGVGIVIGVGSSAGDIVSVTAGELGGGWAKRGAQATISVR